MLVRSRFYYISTTHNKIRLSKKRHVTESKHSFRFDTDMVKMFIFVSDLASHRRSWWFWADSVAAPANSAFHSAKAKSWDDFKKGRIDESSIVNMGIDCPPR